MKVIIIFFLVIINLNANKFFDVNKDTWFFGKNESIPKETNTTKKTKQNVESYKTRFEEEQDYIRSIPFGNLDKISAKEFQEMITKTKEISVVRPTTENVSAFIKLQKHASDQSTKFMDAWQVAIIQDPTLSDNMSTHKRERNRQNKVEELKKEKFISKIKDNIILVMFYDENDIESSKEQIYYYKQLIKEHNLKFTTISIQKNPNYINSLNLLIYPENWYYYEDENGSSWSRIGVGVKSKDELINNLQLIHSFNNK